MGAIVGIVVAIVAIVLPLLALAFSFYRRKKSYLEGDFQSKFVVLFNVWLHWKLGFDYMGLKHTFFFFC